MADALASGASVRKDVGVQVPSRPPVGSEAAPRSSSQGVQRLITSEMTGCSQAHCYSNDNFN